MNKGRLIPQIRNRFYRSSQRFAGTSVPIFSRNHIGLATREMTSCNKNLVNLVSSFGATNRFYSIKFGSYLSDLDIFSRAKEHFKMTMANIAASAGLVVDPLAHVDKNEELDKFVQMVHTIWSDLETIADPDILWMLSELYSHGLGGLEKDGEMAVKLLEKSIAMGSVPAMLLYGIRLLYGVENAIGINEREGFKFIKMAADHGDDSGQNILGFMMCFGTSFHNPAEGVKYLKKAANQNNALAMDNLGRVYEKGIPGIEKNEKLAFKWYKKGAQFGHPNSQFKLGEMYTEGKHDDDVEEPLNEGVKWLFMSAANRNPEALNKLGVLYRDGVGLKQDFELARQFLNLSIQFGSFNAVSDMIKLQVMEMKKISSQENVLNENVDTISAGVNKNTDKQNLRQFPNEERSPKEANDFEKVTWKHDFNSKPSHKKC